MPIPAQIKYIALFILFTAATFSFSKTSLQIWENSKRVENLQSDVSTLQEQKQTLISELSYVRSVEYIEREARNRLNLIKPNERVFISPVVLSARSEDASGVTGNSKSNLDLWVDLFF